MFPVRGPPQPLRALSVFFPVFPTGVSHEGLLCEQRWRRFC